MIWFSGKSLFMTVGARCTDRAPRLNKNLAAAREARRGLGASRISFASTAPDRATRAGAGRMRVRAFVSAACARRTPLRGVRVLAELLQGDLEIVGQGSGDLDVAARGRAERDLRRVEREAP